MKFKNLGSVVLFGGSLISQAGFATQQTMVFKNNYGSILELIVAEDSSVKGYFTTKVATKDCPQAIGQKRPVLGFLAGNALSLSINYPDCGSALSINGNLKEKNQAMDTTWIVSHQLVSVNTLKAQFIGNNIYKRVG
jgi:hypothetical protein